MATIVLTAVGSAVGGPIGAAIGAFAGQQIDRMIFGSGKARQGPRLKELEVQTSSYGNRIPAILGAMRVAGTVIWSTDIKERRIKSGGGKNRPSTVNYSYSVSLAVALSSRPILRIGRIWADGNLIRGADGAFKVDTEFRFHDGYEDQPIDTLIGSAETIANCPAYRGVAYAVFEDLQLADFGNRIPSFTFEIIERDGPVSVSEVAEIASTGHISGSVPFTVHGYAVQGDSGRAVLEPLLAAYPVSIRQMAGDLEIVEPAPVVKLIDPGACIRSDQDDRPSYSSVSPDRLPAKLTLRYFDKDRDFQLGIQEARRSVVHGKHVQIELPATLDAASASVIADNQLLSSQRRGRQVSLAVASNGARHVPGDRIAFVGGTESWRVRETELAGKRNRISAESWFDLMPAHGGGDDGGRSVPSPDLVIGQTRLMLVDLPALTGVDPGAPLVAAAAAGVGPGWRRAALLRVDGDRRIEIGPTAAPAIMGQAITALGLHNIAVIDRKNGVEVELLHPGMELPVGTGDPLSFDAPTILLGQEYLRYGHAEQVSASGYRLTNLVRGLHGSGNATANHLSGEPFLLLDLDVFRMINDPAPTTGSTIAIEAMGLNDLTPVSTSLVVDGLAIKPRPPVHLRSHRDGNGDIVTRWVPVSRVDSGWPDAADMPTFEGGLSFEIELIADAVPVSTWSVEGSEQLLSAAELATLGIASNAVLSIRARQVGKFQRSDWSMTTAVY